MNAMRMEIEGLGHSIRLDETNLMLDFSLQFCDTGSVSREATLAGQTENHLALCSRLRRGEKGKGKKK